jgi:hypothetical protein
LPEEKYGDVQVILWILQIAMGYWTDNPDALRIAQEVRQKRLLPAPYGKNINRCPRRLGRGTFRSEESALGH